MNRGLGVRQDLVKASRFKAQKETESMPGKHYSSIFTKAITKEKQRRKRGHLTDGENIGDPSLNKKAQRQSLSRELLFKTRIKLLCFQYVDLHIELKIRRRGNNLYRINLKKMNAVTPIGGTVRQKLGGNCLESRKEEKLVQRKNSLLSKTGKM